jgi:hypothetical protein
MEYKYTLEHDMPINVTVTLNDVDSLIELLEPMAKDDGHSSRWKASRLVRELRQIKRSALSSASNQLRYEYDKVVKADEASSDVNF